MLLELPWLLVSAAAFARALVSASTAPLPPPPQSTSAPAAFSNATLGFQHIYVLHNPKNAEKKRGMRVLQQALGLELSYFPSEEKATIDPDAHAFIEQDDVWSAHIAAWRDMSRVQNYTTALILADDVNMDVAIRQLADQINGALATSEFTWDMMYLGHCNEPQGLKLHFKSPNNALPLPAAPGSMGRIGDDVLFGHERIHFAHEPHCLHAYAVTRHAAEMLLDRLVYHFGAHSDTMRPLETSITAPLDARVAEFVSHWPFPALSIHPILVSRHTHLGYNPRRSHTLSGSVALNHGIVNANEDTSLHPDDPQSSIYRVTDVALHTHHDTFLCADRKDLSKLTSSESCPDNGQRFKMITVGGRRVGIFAAYGSLSLRMTNELTPPGINVDYYTSYNEMHNPFNQFILAENCGRALLTDRTGKVLCVDDAVSGRPVFREQCAPDSALMVYHLKPNLAHIRTRLGVYLTLAGDDRIALSLSPGILNYRSVFSISEISNVVVIFKSAVSGRYLTAPRAGIDGRVTLETVCSAASTLDLVPHWNGGVHVVLLRTTGGRYIKATPGDGEAVGVSEHGKEWEMFAVLAA